MTTVDLTTVAKNLSGEAARIELERFQTTDGQMASRQRDMLLSDVYFTTIGNASLKNMVEIQAIRALTKKVQGGKAFDVTGLEFEVLYNIYKAQRFYIFESFLSMCETLNTGFDFTKYESLADTTETADADRF